VGQESGADPPVPPQREGRQHRVTTSCS